jgi:glycosyltransferase involved in cell wall biosynthesis
LKVIFWAESFLPDIGGVQVFASHLLPFMRDCFGIQFLVVCCNSLERDPVKEWKDIPVCRFPFHPVLLSRNPTRIGELKRQVAELIEDFKPDLIHINSNQPSLFFLQEHLEKPCLFSGHEPVLAKSRNSLLSRTVRSCNYLTTPSHYLMDQFLELVPEMSEKSELVSNGLPPSDIEPSPLPFSPAHFLCLGRLVNQKGYDLAVSAMAELAAMGRRPILTIAGEGPEQQKLVSMAEELGLSMYIHFPGPLRPSEVYPMINEATAVIVPSRWGEAFGLTALEGGLLERPILASRVGGLSEVVVDGRTGYLFEPGDFRPLAKCMLKIIDSKETSDQLGKEGKKRVIEKFTLARSAQAYCALYEKFGRG